MLKRGALAPAGCAAHERWRALARNAMAGAVEAPNEANKATLHLGWHGD
jgi:hypothetical protein